MDALLYHPLHVGNFLDHLKEEQAKDLYICSAKDAIQASMNVTVSLLKRVQHQLKIINGVLTNLGQPVLPLALRRLVIAESHNIRHFDTDIVYALLKEHFYWSNIYQYVKTSTAGCQACQKSKWAINRPNHHYCRFLHPVLQCS